MSDDASETARREANRVRQQRYRRSKGVLPVQQSLHGTVARYRRHLRNGDEPCDLCLQAHREARRAERAAKKAATLDLA